MAKAGHPVRFQLEDVQRIRMIETGDYRAHIRAASRDGVGEVQLPWKHVHQLNKLRDALANRFGVTLDESVLRDIVAKAEAAPLRYGVSRLGWTPDHAAFVGDKIFRTDRTKRYISVAPRGTLTAQALAALRPTGDRTEQYRLLDRLRLESEIFRFVVGLVAVSPLLEVLGAPTIMFHLAGPTGVFKSTLLRLGISIYADPESHIMKVNFAKDSPNYVDSVLGVLHNYPPLLDETTLHKPTQLVNAAYHVASGMTKGRLLGAEHNFSAADSYAYTVVCLMSGETSILEKMTNLGSQARMLEIQVNDHLLSEKPGENLFEFPKACFGWFGHDLLKAVFGRFFRDSRAGEKLRQQYDSFRAEMRKRWPDDHGRLIDALAAFRLGDYLVARQLGTRFSSIPKSVQVHLRKRAKRFTTQMYYRLTRTADLKQVIKKIRVIPKIKRWLNRGYIPLRILNKHQIASAFGLTKKGEFLKFLKTNGLVEKSQPRQRKHGKGTWTCYILTDRGRKLLAPRWKQRPPKAA